MNVIVQGKELKITQGLRNFIQQQADKLNRLGQRISNVRVYIEQVARKDSDPQRAEVRYKVELPGKDVVVTSHGHDMYQVIIDATDNVVRHVRKFKEKRLTLHRKLAAKARFEE